MEVIVVDHGDDGSAEVATSLGAGVIRDPANPGYGTGQNHGMARTATDYVLLVNPDAVIEARGIEKGIAPLDAAPDVATTQGVIRNVATGRPERSQGVALGPLDLIALALGLRRLLRFGVARRFFRRAPTVADHFVRTPDEPTDVESLGATALLVGRKGFEAVGGFDEGFFLYGETSTSAGASGRPVGGRWPCRWADHAQGVSSSGWWVRELVCWEGTLRYDARLSAPAWAGARVATGLRILPMIAAQPKRTPEVLARFSLCGSQTLS